MGTNIVNINENDVKYMVMEAVNQLLTEKRSLIDNFDMVANILDINSPDDYHFVQIIKRFKDNPNDNRNIGNYHGGAWYLGGFRVHSPEELMGLKQQIITTCDANNARAYITINNRSDKETDSYIQVYRRQFRPTDARYIYADQIVPGQAKDGPNWAGKRKRLLIDIDVPKNERTRDGKNVWAEVKKILQVAGVVPIGEYVTPSGGLHIILPDKEDDRYLTIKDLFRRFDNWRDMGRHAMVHPNVDAKIILYSNVETAGY